MIMAGVRNAVEVNVACPNVPGKPLVGCLALFNGAVSSWLETTDRTQERTFLGARDVYRGVVMSIVTSKEPTMVEHSVMVDNYKKQY